MIQIHSKKECLIDARNCLLIAAGSLLLCFAISLVEYAEGREFGRGENMINAAQEGNIILLRELIAHGKNVDVDFFGLKPLYFASSNGHTEAAEILIDFGADIDSPNGPSSRTALHEAVLRGHYEVVKLLLEKGASVDAQTTHGRRPIDYALDPPFPLSRPENGDNIARLLISFGASR